ncbi:MAG: hypothetical protein RSD36_10025 [Terrisporobacter sp.]
MKMIIATLLSAAISSLLLYILNNKICGIFKEIQRDLRNLSNKTRRILRFSGFILAISLSVFLSIRLDISDVKCGIILGFLISIVDTCFENNVIENIIESNE